MSESRSISMSQFFSLLLLTAVLGVGRSVFGCGGLVSPQDLKQLVGNDAEIRSKAVFRLRADGPDTLPELHLFRERLQTLQTAARQAGQDDQIVTEQLARLEASIDEISGQRHACHSRLFWHTDLDQAKAAAAREQKPILSLRLLGKLTEDYSCANSRFFRTTLYANADVSKLLRERFVLHWKSVRPVPRVTIDFGDGRKLERTLTGNSIHYVLAADGQIVDALPGLYGPAAFLEHLNQTLLTEKAARELNAKDRAEFFVAHHQQSLVELDNRWANDFQNASRMLIQPLNQPAPKSLEEIKAALNAANQGPQQQQVKAPAPPAAKAVKVAITKMVVEDRLVRAAAPAVPADPSAVNDDRLWQMIAELHAQEAKLDAASLNLIRSENPTAAQAGRLARGKERVEDPVLRMVRSLESSIAVDTVRNEYQLHRQIHQWLAAGEQFDVENFNERVYAQLFLTPSSDPWLGLAPADTYSALPNAGVAAAKEIE